MQTSDKVGSIVSTGCICTYLPAPWSNHAKVQSARPGQNAPEAEGSREKEKKGKGRLGCVVGGGGGSGF